MNRVFIVWGRELVFSSSIASALDAELKQVYFKKIGRINLPVLLRYFFQSVYTFFYLLKRKPSLVLVQNPPTVALLVVWLYCLFCRAKFAIDSHTAAFGDQKWINFFWLFKFLARKAVLNTCHNYKNLLILKDWGIEPSMVLQFYNPEYLIEKLQAPLKETKIADRLRQSTLPIMMVNRFADDDDFLTVVKTARLMPEADFFITGNINESPYAKDSENLPANICLTNYLPHEEFLKLMYGCKVILAFTLRADTVLWSIREIMSLNKPFVTSDSEVLRHYYGEVALFTKSSPAELRQRIREAVEQEPAQKERIKKFLTQDKQRWSTEIGQVKKYLGITN